MNAGEFARRRARIEREHGRTEQWKKRALQQLVREARATPVHANGRTVAWRMPDGVTVCFKHRYADSDTASEALRMIALTEGTHTKPRRAYPCPHCGGWHLTSAVIYCD